MNRVVEISEPGPNDGKTVSMPPGGDAVVMTELRLDGGRHVPVRVEYVDSGRKNEFKQPIFVRAASMKEST